MAGTQVHLIISVAVAFVAGLFGVVALLSLLRRRRNPNPPQPSVAEIFAKLSDETRPMNAIDDTQQIIPLAALTARLINPTPKNLPLPDDQRLPVQPGTPEQVVLSIEPNAGPTREQRNVQKLIEFLKQESPDAETEPIQKVS